MEPYKLLTLKQWPYGLFLITFAIIGLLASLSQAETHYHEFVVCILLNYYILFCWFTRRLELESYYLS